MNHPEPKKLGRPPKYPWRTMEVGDSFFAPRSGHSIRNDARASYSDKKFKTKTVMLQGIVGTRVWRIA